jgi:hypothetical protein
MHWNLDLDMSLLVSGIARKDGIVPNHFWGALNTSPPPKKINFFLEQEIFVKESLWLLKSAITRKCF